MDDLGGGRGGGRNARGHRNPYFPQIVLAAKGGKERGGKKVRVNAQSMYQINLCMLVGLNKKKLGDRFAC